MTENVMSNFWVGIISGLVATLFALVIRNFWNNVIIPWYEERIYRDAHIEGKWGGKFYFEGDKTEEFIVNIKRVSHSIYGNMISKEDGKEYDVEGEFRNMILTLVYSSKVVYEVDRGCLTLLLTRNGKELNGHIAYFYSKAFRTKTAPVILSRATSKEEKTLLESSPNNAVPTENFENKQ